VVRRPPWGIVQDRIAHGELPADFAAITVNIPGFSLVTSNYRVITQPRETPTMSANTGIAVLNPESEANLLRFPSGIRLFSAAVNAEQ
jgi:hypothetical protein